MKSLPRRNQEYLLRILLLFCFCLTLIGCSGGTSAPPGTNPNRTFPLSSLQRSQVVINGQTFRVWVMDTDAKRSEGMMYLTDSEVQADEGMLFVFPNAQARSFFMRNTYIPLDIAFIGANKSILNIRQMQPFDETSVPSNGPAQYALEVKQGTFARLGISAGMTVDIPTDVQAQN